MPSYAGGGAERLALFLARSLAEAGLRVDLVVARARGPLRDAPLAGVRKVELGASDEMLATPAWVRYLRRERPRCAMSLVHSANLISGLGALFVSDVPLIVSLHIAAKADPNVQWWFRRWFGFGPEARLYARAVRVVGVSRGVADEAIDVFQLDPSRVRTIPNPLKTGESSPTILPEHEPLFEKPVVLGVGRLAPQKNFEMLIDAFSRVASTRDVNLVVLGEGPSRRSLMQRVDALGLTGRAFFPGLVDNPRAYMRRARVFALSSRNEGFGMALVEALEAGTAIVSTDCAFGPSEVLDGGRFGRLVAEGDEVAFADALAAELDAPRVDHDTRRAERAEWLKQFDPEHVASRYLALVREVIAETGE